MRIVNLCTFIVSLGEEELAPAAKPLLFAPRLAGEGKVKTLLGYEPPKEMASLPEGTEVIVPRFAPAIAAAQSARLVPLTVPQKHTGDRGAPNGGKVVLGANELEAAPEGLAVKFPDKEIPGDFALEEIQRMVQGSWVVKARGIGEIGAVPQGAHDLPDGSAVLPTVREGAKALLVPNSGPCVRAAAATGLAVLVTSAVGPDGQVDLYRVA